MNLKHYLVEVIIPFISIMYLLSNITVISGIEYYIVGGLYLVLNIWTVLHDSNLEKIPTQPMIYSIITIILGLILIGNYIGFTSDLATDMGIFAISAVSSIVLWIFTTILFTGIFNSTTDWIPTHNEHIDDEFNDPHAADILDDNS